MASAKRPWVRPLIVGFAIFVAIGVTFGFSLLSRWTDVRDALPPEAQAAFDAALVEAGGPPAYLTLTTTGAVLNRDLEAAEPLGFAQLKVLAWSAAEQKIIRAEYPHWFVRLKTSSALNLGTMISAVRGDWGHIDLSVSYADLTRRGPGLVLDQQLKDGSRIMLWTVSR